MTGATARSLAGDSELNEPWPRGVSRKPLFSIGQVVERLKQEFPAITLSKLRFLEERGIVSPYRTASMYRKFSAADIERIRYCLIAQRESFLPLDQIKDNLERLDAGEDVHVEPVARVVASAGVAVTPVDGSWITQRELEDYTGASEEQVATLVDCGLLVADSRGRFPASSVSVTRHALAINSGGVPLHSLKLLSHCAHRMAYAAMKSTVVQKGSATMISERRRAQAQDIVREASQLVFDMMRAEIDREL